MADVAPLVDNNFGSDIRFTQKHGATKAKWLTNLTAYGDKVAIVPRDGAPTSKAQNTDYAIHKPCKEKYCNGNVYP